MKLFKFTLLTVLSLKTVLSFCYVSPYIRDLPKNDLLEVEAEANVDGNIFAYITDTSNNNSVHVLDTPTNTVVGSPIPVDNYPTGIAITKTSSGTFAYVVNRDSGTVRVINIDTDTVVGPPIQLEVGITEIAIATTASGTFAYITNYDKNNVSVINTENNTVLPTPIDVGAAPIGITIVETENGLYAYVANLLNESVSVIDTETNIVQSIDLGSGTYPISVTSAITSTGTFAYVVSQTQNGTVIVIDTKTNTVVGAPLDVGSFPNHIATAYTPYGAFTYVANAMDGTVSVIDTEKQEVLPNPIDLGGNPAVIGVANVPIETEITSTAFETNTVLYVTNSNGTIGMINVATNQPIEPPIQFDGIPLAIAIAPSNFSPSVTVSGYCKKNSFFTQTERFIVVKWSPSEGVFPLQYKIFRDGELIATVPATNKLAIEDHNRKKGTAYSYQVDAEDDSGTIATGTTTLICH